MTVCPLHKTRRCLRLTATDAMRIAPDLELAGSWSGVRPMTTSSSLAQVDLTARAKAGLPSFALPISARRHLWRSAIRQSSMPSPATAFRVLIRTVTVAIPR